jgi:FKBP-type peptidyl-prolyl cis-trans isomerase
MRTITLAATLLALAACSTESPVSESLPIEQTTFAPALGVNLATSTKTAEGLYYRDLVVGTGAELSTGRTVSVFYQGSLANGSQFDATGSSPFAFRLGVGQVIRGWDLGVAGMKVGGRRQLIIPPSLGYGGQRVGPIPPNSILVFTVEAAGVQ